MLKQDSGSQLLHAKGGTELPRPFFIYNESALAWLQLLTTTVSWFTDVSTERHNKEILVLGFHVWGCLYTRAGGLGHCIWAPWKGHSQLLLQQVPPLCDFWKLPGVQHGWGPARL